MGVIACDREDCPSVMCEYYSEEYGYLCNSCMQELLLRNMPISVFMTDPKRPFWKGNYYRECLNTFSRMGE